MDYKNLGNKASKSDPVARSTVAGRVLQHDTDFTCYICASHDVSIIEAFKEVLGILDFTRRMAGAETVNMHLTMGLKGGRNEIATVRPYQEKRNPNPELSARVKQLRVMLSNFVSERFVPVINVTQEADDSLRQYQARQISLHGIDKSVLSSGDKDLWFTNGLHISPAGRIHTVEGYGETMYKNVGNKKPKLVGRGMSWFWHQMIMGDGADNIPGLPQISGRLLNIYLPTKKVNPNRNSAPCGEAKAVAMLKGVTTEREAARRVLEAYVHHYGASLALEMLVEQAFLLYIRETPRLTEVLEYLGECGIVVQFSDQQKTALNLFIKRAEELLGVRK